MTKLDILVLAAHPDDAELGCGGTIAKHVARGYKVGIVDLTAGELGTRGTPEIRQAEATAAAKILNVAARENLGLTDGFFENNKADQRKVIAAIRAYQPTLVLANAVSDRHPDHGRGASLVADACFLAGLAKVETTDGSGKPQMAWRPKAVYHFIQSNLLMPHFVVDVSEHWQQKMEAIRAYKTQFFDPTSREPETFISKPGFLELIESRGKDFGYAIGATYGEGFTVRRLPGVDDLFGLM
ncbi:MAG: bacillithiol biosynthesis deacetylase BshB1 [Cyclobacteriaceae bacterium]|jgi:bacillithiol biosynthesis deacetylase BshB1|nr:bacillithiol biosynthesis deacetylase BshB1 [Cyclobacteriaceae bacterium]